MAKSKDREREDGLSLEGFRRAITITLSVEEYTACVRAANESRVTITQLMKRLLLEHVMPVDLSE